MSDEAASAAPSRTLREKLQARGAKPQRRMSDLSRYMIAHYEELRMLLTVDRYGWTDIASLLAEEEGLTDDVGRPVTAGIAKLTWSRLNRRKLSATPKASVPLSPSASAPPPQPPSPETSNNRDPSFEGPKQPPMLIRPARPRAVGPTTSAADVPRKSTSYLLSEDEVERRLAELAERQGGPKIPPPKVL